MHNCKCNHDTKNHVNAFVDLNGVPYLLAEYLDRNNFQQIDRSLIKSEILVDQSDAMRAVIDISVDDIGKRATDGHPAIVGNNSKQNKLLKMISNNRELMNHQFNVLRRGIVVRVDYQLENYRTQQVIRSASESFRIVDRNYFLDINSRDVNDNAIIANFCNTMVSTINEFTHGQDRMVLRVTNVHLSYEMVHTSPKMPRIKQSMTSCYNSECAPGIYGRENNLYRYHDMMQNRHCMPGCDPYTYGNEDVSMITPPTWSMFNRFYHFDNNGSNIILHDQEINDTMTKVSLVPCGTVYVNRTFIINPGHRLIFKFSIWKNDVTVVNNTAKIAECLQAPVIGCNMYPMHDHHCHHDWKPVEDNCDHHINVDYDEILKILNDGRNIDCKQNEMIFKLSESVSELSEIVKSLIPPSSDEELTPPEDNTTSDVCCDYCNDEHDEIEERLDIIGNNINDLTVSIDALSDVKPISSDVIKEIVYNSSESPITNNGTSCPVEEDTTEDEEPSVTLPLTEPL